MRDYLHTTLSSEELFEMSSTALAHVGDAVFELLVRSNLSASGERTAKKLHTKTVQSVSASAQYDAAARILPLLDEEERGVFMRARNAKVNSLPKHSTPEVYHTATAFEALLGYIYLSGRYERLNELFSIAIK